MGLQIFWELDCPYSELAVQQLLADTEIKIDELCGVSPGHLCCFRQCTSDMEDRKSLFQQSRHVCPACLWKFLLHVCWAEQHGRREERKTFNGCVRVPHHFPRSMSKARKEKVQELCTALEIECSMCFLERPFLLNIARIPCKAKPQHVRTPARCSL